MTQDYDFKNMTDEQLTERVEKLGQDMYMLECGDDFLFTNRNGNLPKYRMMQTEQREICNILAARRANA
jgi:hypothetical protein